MEVGRELELRDGEIWQCVENVENGKRWIRVLSRDKLEAALLPAASPDALRVRETLERGVQLGLDRARRAIRAEFKPVEGTYHPLELIIMYEDDELKAALVSSGASSECQCPYPPEPHPTSVHLVGTRPPTEAEKAYGLTLEPLAKEPLSRDESDKQFYSSSGDARLAMIWEKLKSVTAESQGK